MRNEYLIHVTQCIGDNLDSHIMQFRKKDSLSVSCLKKQVKPMHYACLLHSKGIWHDTSVSILNLKIKSANEWVQINCNIYKSLNFIYTLPLSDAL